MPACALRETFASNFSLSPLSRLRLRRSARARCQPAPATSSYAPLASAAPPKAAHLAPSSLPPTRYRFLRSAGVPPDEPRARLRPDGAELRRRRRARLRRTRRRRRRRDRRPRHHARGPVRTRQRVRRDGRLRPRRGGPTRPLDRGPRTLTLGSTLPARSQVDSDCAESARYPTPTPG